MGRVKVFLKEDVLPISFILSFYLIGMGVVAKLIFPNYPNIGFYVGVIIVLLTLFMFVAYMIYVNKRKDRMMAQEEIEKVVILSTGHLPYSEFNTMTVDDEFPFRAIPHEYGVIIIATKFEDAETARHNKEYMQGHFPVLWDVIQFAWNRGCLYINFDQDGEFYKELKQYDW